ncbi:hypothetical protein CHARACLAT_024510, partial [Characodon lateralis]|nr:hypothetical protein [Characodon lateralis]
MLDKQGWCDWQVLLHRCFSSESNQLGFLWSGNPRRRRELVFSLDPPLLKEVVESLWFRFHSRHVQRNLETPASMPPLCFQLQTQLL